jgi:hypothetical protein
MQSEVEMNAMLACMAARLENVDKVPNQGTNKYMGNALVAVRKRFNTASRHQLLLIMFHLYAGEAYRQNYQAAKIHMKAAQTLFASWGGINHIPDLALKELFIMGDLHMSSCLLEPCQLECVYDPGEYWEVMPPELQLGPEQDFISAAPALQGASVSDYFPDKMKQIILETAECAWILQHARLKPCDAAKHALKWLQWRSAAIRYRLLGMEFSDLGLEAVRISLLLWVLTTMVLLGLKLLGHRVAPKLQAVMMASRNPYLQWQGRIELKTWVLTMGAMCAVTDSEEEDWFVEKLYEVGLPRNIRRFCEAHGGKFATLDVLRNFQEKFFYYDPIQSPRLERLARLISTEKPFPAKSSPIAPARIITPPS